MPLLQEDERYSGKKLHQMMIRFLRSQVRYKRYGVISRIYLQNNQGVYKTHVDSFPAAVHGVDCVRYHIPPSEMVNYPLTSAQ